MQDTASTGEGDASSAGDPGFGDGASGSDALPDMRDNEPSFEEVMSAMEEAMGEGQAGGQGQQAGSGSQGQGSEGQAGSTPGGQGEPGGYGSPGGAAGQGNSPYGGSSRVLTPAEQVAILEGQLEKGTGEFDAMILEEQQAQREAARNSAPTTSSQLSLIHI